MRNGTIPSFGRTDLFKKPLTVCCQLATCFGTLVPLSRNFQQLLFSLYNYFKLLMMDEGDRNMQQADYRQLGVSHCIKVYRFLFVLRATPILIAIFFLISPQKHN
jgi:mannose/fructose/N-acetylgalactosamine-specific phosphotransferase system component IIC